MNRRLRRLTAAALLSRYRLRFGLGELVSPSRAAHAAIRLWLTPPPGSARRFAGARSQVPAAIPTTVETSAGSVRSLSWGAGPPIYFMHGWGGSGLQIEALITPLVRRGFRVVTFDAPGHGTNPRRPTHAGEFGQALAAVADHHGQPHGVIAHSLGAVAVTRAVVDHQMQPGRLVLLAPLVDASTALTQYAQLVGLGRRTRSLLSAEVRCQTALDLAQFTCRDLPSHVDGLSTLIAHDRSDTFASFGDSSRLASRWNGATLSPVRGVGHHRILLDPDVISAAVHTLTTHPTSAGRSAVAQTPATAPGSRAVQAVEREAEVVLCSRDHQGADRLWGALPPMPVAAPWWPEAWDVVEAVQQRHAIQVTVLRLLTTSQPRMPGGRVSYLAEVSPETDLSGLPLRAWTSHNPLAPEPLRQAWAHPGGPHQLVAWAQDRLEAAGIAVRGPAVQRKTWNLSTLWLLPTKRGPVWLKAVPEFFSHEGAVMERLGPAVTPQVYAAEPGRLLLADAPGDNMDTRGPALAPMVDLLTGVQADWAERVHDLLALGLPDRRLTSEIPRIEQVVSKHETTLSSTDRADLHRLVAGLAARVAAIADCGVPETLTHGDFHPGNVRGQNGHFLIMDWGDSCISHPMTDELAFTRRLDPADREAAADWFTTAWQDLVPGCDPERASTLLRPLSPLIAAVTYAEFVRQIEPDEQIYHADDVPHHLAIAAAEYRAELQSTTLRR